MSWNIDRERNATASNQVSNDMTFKERDVGTEINRDGGPGIGERKLGKGDVMVLINREGRMIEGVEETIQGSFNFRGVGDFTFDGWASHLSVIISWLFGERAREGSLQTRIGSGGANGFSDAVGRRNILRARRVRSSHRGAGGRPSLLHTKGSESKG